MNKVKESAGTECPPKVKAIYQAVFELFEEGADLNGLTVSEITKKAGIGKGTAYEYFSDKEEMIARAIFYNVELFCQKICEGVDKEKSLYDKVNFVLLTMERQVPHANCLFRLVHIISGNSDTNRRFREVIEQQKLFGEMPVVRIARQMLEDSFKDKKGLLEEKKTYLVMSVYSKILCYGMILNGEEYNRAEQRDIMRSLICQGICKEVEQIEVL
ncbi:MAG: TetR/AcrR family transcriptional regulator [Lachnospiraceae bacterium]|nr:TetR/AcrR family transcriptional regulator [Lachnospiraceae bacterium]